MSEAAAAEACHHYSEASGTMGGGMAVSESVSDVLIFMQGKGVPKEKAKGIQLSLGLSATIWSISINFKGGLRRKLGYLNKTGTYFKELWNFSIRREFKDHHTGILQMKNQRGKVAYLKCISIGAMTST